MPETVPVALARLLSLLSWIGDNPGVTTAEAADHFGRTMRQIRRDIEALGSVGDSLPGSSFELDWSLYEDEDRLQVRTTLGADLPPRLTAAEAAAVLVGLEAISPGLDQDLRARIPRTALAVRALAGGGVNADVLHLRTTSAQDDRVARIAEAIEQDRALSFIYTSAAGVRSERRVDPWEVRRGSGGWLLRGWCHRAEGERTFTLGGMEDLNIEDAAREHRQAAGGMPAPTRRLRLGRRARWILDELRLEPLQEALSGEFSVDIPVWDERWFEGLLVDLAEHLVAAEEDTPASSTGDTVAARLRAGNRARLALVNWEMADRAALAQAATRGSEPA